MIAKCPGCGAPSTPGATVCRYCNSSLLAPPPRAPAQHAAAHNFMPMVLGGIVVSTALAGAGAFLARDPYLPGSYATDTADPARPARERPSTLLAALPDGDLLVNFYRKDKHHVARLDGAALTKKWESVKSSPASQSAPVLGDSTAVFAEDERLRAYDLADGRMLWDVGLVAGIQQSANLQRVGDTVLAWQKDKSLQAFDMASGAVRWTRRTSRTSDRLITVAGKILSEAEGDPKKFTLLDPLTGTPSAPAHVSCDRKPTAFSAAYDSLQQATATPDGAGLVIFMGFHQLCLAHFDPVAMKTAWTAPIKDSIRAGWSDGQAMLVDQTDVLLGGDDVLLAFDLATGKPRDLVREPDSNFRPWQSHGDTVFAVTWPDYDSNKLTLRAIGRDGAPRWQHRLSTSDNSGREWGFTATADAVYTWQTDDEAKNLAVERIDRKTGQLLERKAATPTTLIAPRIFGQLTSPTRAWIVASGDFATIDLATGATDHI